MAFYCLILKRLSRSYPTLFITRKVFFLWDYFLFSSILRSTFKYQTRVIETANRIFKYIISGCHRLNALLYHVEYGSQSLGASKQPIIFTLSLWSP